ncbi:MAG: cupin domain-containing protein [Bacteroidia bacterium]|nr:cupin domain-containing protein [Bacteroidia bacterium]
MDKHTFISSGILESYVLGLSSESESRLAEKMISQYPEIKSERDQISLTLEKYAFLHQVQPPAHLKDSLMREITLANDFSTLPYLSETSSSENWIARIKNITPPQPLEDIYLHRLGESDDPETYIAWAKTGIPPEVHTDTLESFLILEGTCTCYIGEQVTDMSPGDFMVIPLYIEHSVTVTSEIPLKVILQKRKAA